MDIREYGELEEVRQAEGQVGIEPGGLYGGTYGGTYVPATMTPNETLAQEAPTRPEVGTQAREGDDGFTQLAGRSSSPLAAAFRRFLRDWRAVAALAILIVIVAFSFIFPLFYQHMGGRTVGGNLGNRPIGPEQYHQFDFNDLSHPGMNGTIISVTFTPPFVQFHFGGPDAAFHPLGSDSLGRDILARLMAGVSISIELAIVVELFDVGLGLLFGTLAGWYSGWLGFILDRFTDVMFAFPGLLLIILMGATLGPVFDDKFKPIVGPIYSRIFLLVLAIGLLAWPLMMRFVRGSTLQLKEQQYVEAARVSGTPNRKIIMRHVIPNLMNVVIVASTLSVLGTIIGEAGLSALGVGIRPPGSSLGLMISDGLGDLYILPGEVLWPVLVLIIIVVCLSFIGDGVRDAFDPRTKD